MVGIADGELGSLVGRRVCGLVVGAVVGTADGEVGSLVGRRVCGLVVGSSVLGFAVGVTMGTLDGRMVLDAFGTFVGFKVGMLVGSFVGFTVGVWVGLVGRVVGLEVGTFVGLGFKNIGVPKFPTVGEAVFGETVGFAVGESELLPIWTKAIAKTSTKTSTRKKGEENMTRRTKELICDFNNDKKQKQKKK